MRQRCTTGLELVLCSCETECFIVLTDDEELVCTQVWALQDRATELLAPSLDMIFRQAGRSFQELRRIGCVHGPGSFTGTRLVLATAAALRRATRARLAALDYMQALAATAAMNRELFYGRRVWVLTHARRGLVHARPFMSLGPVIPPCPLETVRLMSLDEALTRVQETAAQEAEPVIVCGSALARAPRLAEALETLGRDKVLSGRPVRPSIDALRLLGRHGDYFDRDVDPLYVRPCDAVDNLPSLSERMGRDADASARELDRLLSRAPGAGVGVDDDTV